MITTSRWAHTNRDQDRGATVRLVKRAVLKNPKSKDSNNGKTRTYPKLKVAEKIYTINCWYNHNTVREISIPQEILGQNKSTLKIF